MADLRVVIFNLRNWKNVEAEYDNMVGGFSDWEKRLVKSFESRGLEVVGNTTTPAPAAFIIGFLVVANSEDRESISVVKRIAEIAEMREGFDAGLRVIKKIRRWPHFLEDELR